MTFVVDASVALTWVLESERSAVSTDVLMRVRADGAMAPSLWLSETANGLLVAERRHRIDAAGLAAGLAFLRKLPILIQRDDDAETWDAVIGLARRNELTVYDACYLELAMRWKVPLATFDRALLRAARGEGIIVL